MIWNTFCEKRNEIYRSFLAMLIYGTVISLGRTSFGIAKLSPLLTLFTILTFAYVVFQFELPIIWKSILASLAVSFVVVRCILWGKDELLTLAKGFWEWIQDPMAWTEHFRLYIGIVIFVVALLCYFAGYLCEKNKYVKYSLFFIGIAVAVYLMILEEEVSKPGIAFLFCFFFFICVEWLEGRWKKNRDSGMRVLYMICLWPVWLIFIIVMSFTPVSVKPYDWQFVKDIINNIESATNALTSLWGTGDTEEFSVGMNGFSEDGQIDGDTDENGKVLLKVNAAADMVTNVYLTGIIADTFDGREWSTQYEEVNGDKLLDTLETLYAIWRYDLDATDKYVEKATLKIEYQDFESSYFFMPIKCQNLVVNGTNMISIGKEYDKAWSKKKRQGELYTTAYHQLNLGNEEFTQMLLTVQEENPDIWRKVCLKDARRLVDYTILKEYRRRQKEQYSAEIPLSEEMQQWVAWTTSGCINELERLRAIESALSELDYTLYPGEIPSTVDSPSAFLDYFLFDKREGYCTYFATAFTLLARAEGLPARFVQGFMIPMKGSRSASVTGDMAHAWSEVYFEGVGWIPFEPTPGSLGIRYTPWEKAGYGDAGVAVPGQDEVVSEGPTKPDEEPEELEEELWEEDTEELEDEGKNGRPRIDAAFIAWGFGLALFLSLIMLCFNVAASRRSYRRKGLTERYRWEVERCIAVLARLGIQKKAEETLSDLQRIMEDKYKEWDELPPEFIPEYENVLYGTKPVSDRMIEQVMTERRKIKLRLNVWKRLVEDFKDYRKR